MMKKKDGDRDDDDQDEDSPREANPKGRVEKYIGVKVKNAVHEAVVGGSKNYCCPYTYLFDEIDAALDPQYRTAVGNMIRRLTDKENTQFIAATFRPELVKVADKIFGVTHKNKVSRVNVISENDALEFINQDQTQNAE